MSTHNENTRLETFCDGVIAIAITLLILEIKVPPFESIHSVHDLTHALLESWPHWFGFLLSFIAILIAWVNHHSLFKLVDKSSPTFIYANGFLLLTLVVLPFPTALIAEYIQTEYAQPAVSLYCFVGVVHNFAWNILLYTMQNPVPLTRHDASQKAIALGKNSTRAGFFLYLGIFILSFWYPFSALILITTSWLTWLVLGLAIKQD